MSYSIFDVVKDTVTGKVEKSDKELIQNRIKLCEECDQFKKTFRICGSCGCLIDVKCKYKSAQCPLGKW